MGTSSNEKNAPGGEEGPEADPWRTEEGVLEWRELSLSPGLEALLGSEAMSSSNSTKFSAVFFKQ